MAEAIVTLTLKSEIDWNPVLYIFDQMYSDGIFWARIDECGWPLRASNEIWLAQWAIDNRMFRQGCIAE